MKYIITKKMKKVVDRCFFIVLTTVITVVAIMLTRCFNSKQDYLAFTIGYIIVLFSKYIMMLVDCKK